MATPIQPTPALTGQDAIDLLDALDRVASPDEISRRSETLRRQFNTQRHCPTCGALPGQCSSSGEQSSCCGGD